MLLGPLSGYCAMYNAKYLPPLNGACAGYNDDSSEKAKQESMFIVQEYMNGDTLKSMVSKRHSLHSNEYMNGGTLKSKVSKQMLSPSNTVYSNKQ
eukprot:scaffold35010_cov20-Tisochrysis_lutea.AAC.1